MYRKEQVCEYHIRKDRLADVLQELVGEGKKVVCLGNTLVPGCFTIGDHSLSFTERLSVAQRLDADVIVLEDCAEDAVPRSLCEQGYELAMAY